MPVTTTHKSVKSRIRMAKFAVPSVYQQRVLLIGQQLIRPGETSDKIALPIDAFVQLYGS